MSYWGATVITSLITEVPFIGETLLKWIWGGFSVADPILNRLYSIHYTLPFLIVGLIFFHLNLLHDEASSNPKQAEEDDSIPFYPYYFWEDAFAFNISLIAFTYIVFVSPNYFGHPDIWIKANPLVTPAHIVLEWYFTFVSIKTGGVISMALSILVLFLIPLYREKEKSVHLQFHFILSFFYWQFIAVFLY